MTEPILVVMAAGMGSRFGGPKQIRPLGPCGEILLDYSLYDARRAGFSRVVFVINHKIEADFAAAVTDRLHAFDEVRTVFQETPPERIKPLGTGHAVLSARAAIDAPFAVINADDFYGAGAFSALYGFLSQPHPASQWCMVGYRLGDTLSESGAVSRGICTVQDGFLTSVTEHTGIEKTAGGARFLPDGTAAWKPLSPDLTVSMNCWGFSPDFLDALAQDFSHWREHELAAAPQTAEFYLPAVVQRRLEQKTAAVAVLPAGGQWFGVTYPQDAQSVSSALSTLTARGSYPHELRALLGAAWG